MKTHSQYTQNESRQSDIAQLLSESSQLSEKIQHDLDFVSEQINHALSDNTPVQTRQLLSFVIPAKDEQDTVATLCERILAAVPEQYDIELLWIDDGSVDATWQRMVALSSDTAIGERASVRALRFRYNVGKAAALTAGFRLAQGDFVFTMDADLQDDPQEIPRFLEKLNAGYDVVTGWKKTRHDPWHKVLPSRVFNWMLSRLTGVKLHDHNCGFKCYRGEVARRLAPHGELHRMMPTLAAMHGYQTAEIEVLHHPRQHGQSKYGWERLARGFSDMLTMSFLKKFGERPSHFVNMLSALQIALAVCFVLSGFIVGQSFLGLAVGSVLTSLAVSTFVLGLLAEMMIRDGRMSERELPVAEIVNQDKPNKQPQGHMTTAQTTSTGEASAAGSPL